MVKKKVKTLKNIKKCKKRVKTTWQVFKKYCSVKKHDSLVLRRKGKFAWLQGL